MAAPKRSRVSNLMQEEVEIELLPGLTVANFYWFTTMRNGSGVSFCERQRRVLMNLMLLQSKHIIKVISQK